MKNLIFIGVASLLFSCSQNTETNSEKLETEPPVTEKTISKRTEARPEIYASFKLTTDLEQLAEYEKQMLPLLIKAAQEMDKVFWKQSVPDEVANNLNRLEEKDNDFYVINYGPWDRLADNKPFLNDIGEKPLGANFYPTNMSKEEFDALEDETKTSLYTVIKRDEAGKLKTVPYYETYSEHHQKAAELLKQAAEICEDASFKKYLNLRAEALLTDNYDPSDIAWLDMETNGIDIIIGPIENYEDKLYGYKAAHEAYVLVKDKTWSERLKKYVKYLPELQSNLPVADEYKAETPGRDAQLNAYDVVFYAGDCNAGSKTIAVNLPNDEAIQQSKGTRRSQLKNAMRAKFDKILVPISEMLIAENQRQHITFEAFFGNTMFHEVAHGLGIKNTINDKGSVREALKEKFSALEEGKADILGLYMVSQLMEKGVHNEGVIMDNYVTFLAGIFRSVRFGAASAHGKANMLRFNYFKDMGAFTKNADGTYSVNPDQMTEAMNSLSNLILKLQGNGDYDGVGSLMTKKGIIDADLQADLDRLSEAGIPVDVVFEQGIEVLGLSAE